jgi:RHS repeat-associated protein
MRMRSLLRSVVLLAGILGSGSAYCCSESVFYLAPNLISIKGQCASRDEALAACHYQADLHGYPHVNCSEGYNPDSRFPNIWGGWWYEDANNGVWSPQYFVEEFYQPLYPELDNDPNLGGPDCDDECSMSAGDPIHVGSGNKFETHIEFRAATPFPLEFSWTYNSAGLSRHFTTASPRLGRNRTHSYSNRLFYFARMQTPLVYVTRPDGKVRSFRLIGGHWEAAAGVDGVLTQLTDGPTLLGWRFEEGGVTETYGASGHYLSRADANGGLHTLEYVGGLLKTVRDQSGRVLSFTYNNDGQIASLELPDGGSIGFAYSASGDLNRVDYPSGFNRQYRYDELGHVQADTVPGALTGVIDEAGVRYSDTHYTSGYRATGTSLAGGIDAHALAYTMHVSGAYSTRTVVTTPLGATREVVVDAVNSRLLPSSIVVACAGCETSTIEKTFDAKGRPDLVVTNGITADHDYDPRGLETQRIDVANTVCPAAVPDCHLAKRKTQTDWRATFRVPMERRTYNAANVLEQLTRFAYNARGQQTARCQVEPSNASAMAYACGSLADAPVGVRQTRADYCDETDADFGTAACPPVGLARSVDGPRTDVADVTTYTYRAADEATCATQPTTCAYRKGDLWKTTNALGQVSEVLAYDGAGRVLSVLDANGVRTDFEYTPRGWLSRRLLRGTDDNSEADDQITTFEYEPYGSINKVTQPDGSYLRYHYDAAHRLTGISDAAGDRIDYALDAAGNRLKEETKDPNGNVKRLLARQFDALSRMRSQISAPFAAMADLDDPAVKKTRFEYDPNGNHTRVTDALDVATDNDHDALNRLIRSIGDHGADGINATSLFTYDARDNLRTVTDPKGLVTTYTYDGLDNLTQLQSPDTGTTSYTHDAAGNRISQTDARGVTSTYAYDALGRLTWVSFSTRGKDLRFIYDEAGTTCRAGERFAIGRLSRFTDETGSTEFCYDRRGQLVRRTSVVAAETYELTWGYDGAGRLTSLTYPSGTVVAYARDNRGRVVGIDVTPANGSATTLISDVAYLPFGPVGTITWGDQSTLARRYDQNYWIDQIASSHPEGLVLDFSTDLVGNIVSLSDTLAPSLPVDSYGYDDLYRLTTQDSAVSGLTQYGYDATGNRTGVTTASSATAYAYPPGSHRLQAVGASLRGYDANGNTTSMNGRTLSYDDRNRLTMINLGIGGSVESRYNARGERVLRVQDSFGTATETRYVYDEAGRLLLELPSKKGASATEIVWLDDLPVGLIDKSGEVRPIEPDHLGSPRKVIDPSRGTALWDWPILGNAFGTAAANDDPGGDGNATTLNLRFPGQQYDAATGLHYNYFRDYDPATGRYVESDPIGLRGGVSTFGYVNQSPANEFDSFGLEGVGHWTFPPGSQRDDFLASQQAKKCWTKDEIAILSNAIGGGVNGAIVTSETGPGAGVGFLIGFAMGGVSGWMQALGDWENPTLIQGFSYSLASGLAAPAGVPMIVGGFLGAGTEFGLFPGPVGSVLGPAAGNAGAAWWYNGSLGRGVPITSVSNAGFAGAAGGATNLGVSGVMNLNNYLNECECRE